MTASKMNRYMLLREYLRTSRRVKLRPSPDGFKKMEYLKFLGAHLCPTCEEDVVIDFYVCSYDQEGGIFERYRCPGCGMEFDFPRSMVH